MWSDPKQTTRLMCSQRCTKTDGTYGEHTVSVRCQATTSTYRPMECFNIDFIGPYPDQGYVLNIIDTFTRWVELYAVPNATAEEACKCLLIHFGRFGSPTIIRSDKGSHFAITLIEHFLKAIGTLQNLTLAYSSQENAIVERNNKKISIHLRALTSDKNTVNDYQQLLPLVQRILNYC
jgi:transposase InsO family protein